MNIKAQECLKVPPMPGLGDGIELHCFDPAISSPEGLNDVMHFLLAGIRMSQGEATIESLLTDLYNRNQLLWIVTEYDVPIGVLCTTILIWPQYKTLRITLLGGIRAKDWWPVMYAIEQYAKDVGCSFIDGQCRKGLEKYTSRLGWKEVYRVFGKSLISRTN